MERASLPRILQGAQCWHLDARGLQFLRSTQRRRYQHILHVLLQVRVLRAFSGGLQQSIVRPERSSESVGGVRLP
eukprot:4718601-Alexandrium_andersonii.AAC.1